MRAPRALWAACALLVVWPAEGSGTVYAEHHGRHPPPPSTSVLDIKNNIAKKVDETIDDPDEVLPTGVDADEAGVDDDNRPPQDDAPAAGYEEDYEAEHDDYGSYSSQPMTFDNLPHVGTLPPVDSGDTEPYSSGEGEVLSYYLDDEGSSGYDNEPEQEDDYVPDLTKKPWKAEPWKAINNGAGVGPKPPDFAPTAQPPTTHPPPSSGSSFFQVKPAETKSEILDGDGSGMPGGGLTFNLAFPPRAPGRPHNPPKPPPPVPAHPPPCYFNCNKAAVAPRVGWTAAEALVGAAVAAVAVVALALVVRRAQRPTEARREETLKLQPTDKPRPSVSYGTLDSAAPQLEAL